MGRAEQRRLIERTGDEVQPEREPSADSPAGNDSAGSPARLAGTVKTSLMYICTGSSIFSPIANAANGAVGVNRTSQVRNASSKSLKMSARTFCAFT